MTTYRIKFALVLLSICSSARAEETRIDFAKQITPIFASALHTLPFAGE